MRDEGVSGARELQDRWFAKKLHHRFILVGIDILDRKPKRESELNWS